LFTEPILKFPRIPDKVIELQATYRGCLITELTCIWSTLRILGFLKERDDLWLMYKWLFTYICIGDVEDSSITYLFSSNDT